MGSSELAKAFMFWPSPDVREGPNVYDIRTYSLKPGSLYDWSNYWSKGIQFRSSFTQSTTSGATSRWQTENSAAKQRGITQSGMTLWQTQCPWSTQCPPPSLCPLSSVPPSRSC